MRLFEPVLQHVLKVNTLPVADPGIELYLQGADADVAATLLRDGLEPEDLQVDGGGLLQRSQVHPQLGLQHLGEHQFGAELEEAAAGLPIHLHQWLRLRGHGDHGLRGGVVLILFHKLVLGRRVSLEVVVVQELLERRRLGQQLIDHLPADVGRLFQAQLAQDLGLDGLQSQHFALLPPHTGGALVGTGVLVQQRQPGIRGRLAGRRQQQIGLIAPRLSQGDEHHQAQ